MPDGHIIFETRLDNAQLIKDLDQAKKNIERIQKQIAKESGKRLPLTSSAAELSVKLDEAKKKLQDLQAEYQRAEAAGIHSGLSSPTAAASPDMETALAGIAEAVSKTSQEVEALQAKFDAVAAGMKAADASAEKLEEDLAGAKGHAAGLEKQLASTQALKPLANSMNEAKKKIATVGTHVKSTLGKALSPASVLGALQPAKAWLVKTIQKNDEAAAAMARLKGALLTLAQPVVEFVIPIFVKLCGVVTRVVQVAAYAASLLFGKNVKDSAKNAEKLNAESDAISGVGDAAEEAAGSLAAFDEINQLEGGGSGGGSGGSAAFGSKEADFSDFGGDEFQQGIDKLTAILGGALFAVGAVLAFSGVNIPLGIGMMVLGAAVLYQEAQLNWDALPQQIQEAISGALVLIGIAALTIGLCLALSGVDIPRGIGLIAIGAVSLCAAAALNWDMLGDTICEKLVNIGMVLGPVIAIIGIFLCLAGHFPIGIGMIIAGVGIFGVSAVALNWDMLGETLAEKLGNIVKTLGGFLVAIGIVLLFVPAAQGIGIAMLVAGAAALIGGSIAAQWDSVPNTVSAKLGLILKVVGESLLVLGLICLLTGAGAPIGLGLILLGIGVLGVSAVSVNWNFITEKIGSIWESVEKYYNNNIKQYFSVAYWKNKASDIIFGLISGIKAGASQLKNAIGDAVSNAWNSIFSDGSSGSRGGSRGDSSGSRGGSRSSGAVSAQATSARIYSAHVPALARGAVIPPNREFLAVLGDQRSGTNVEAPLNTIKQALWETLRESGGLGNSGDIHITVELDGRVVARNTVKHINDMTRQAGRNVLLI